MNRRQPALLPVVPILLGSLLSLVPLAHASRVDAIWIAGTYDAADLDEVVLAATSIAAVTAGRKAAPRAETAWIVVQVARPAEPVRYAGALRSQWPGFFAQTVALSSPLIRSPPAP